MLKAFTVYARIRVSQIWDGFFGLKFTYQLPTYVLLLLTIVLALLQWYWFAGLSFIILLVVYSQAAVVKD